MENFKILGIIEPILQAIEKAGFEKPSEIQSKAIPLVIEGKDVIAGSATGSGKTLVFGSGIIQNSEKGRGIQALILTPTRELAEQIGKELKRFSKNKPLKIVKVYGGVSINPQIEKLETADVVVGTPGRILDHIERHTINIRKISILVLDEADRMLDMGFIDDVQRIIRECPKERQTLLFSATISQDIDHITKRYMRDPIKVSAESYVDPRKLKQIYYDTPDNLKFSLLAHLLKEEKKGLVMVFCNTRRNVDFVANNLKKNNIDAIAIHGGLSQDKRNHILDDFHSKKAYTLVCTDVAARGLDIKGVSQIYNYDIPKESKQYVHRIGRTARAGKEGIAINILSPKDHDNFSRVLRDFSVEVTKKEMPKVEKIRMQREQGRYSRRTGDRFGRSRDTDHRDRRGPGRARGHGRRDDGRGHSNRRNSNRRPNTRRY